MPLITYAKFQVNQIYLTLFSGVLDENIILYIMNSQLIIAYCNASIFDRIAKQNKSYRKVSFYNFVYSILSAKTLLDVRYTIILPLSYQVYFARMIFYSVLIPRMLGLRGFWYPANLSKSKLQWNAAFLWYWPSHVQFILTYS